MLPLSSEEKLRVVACVITNVTLPPSSRNMSLEVMWVVTNLMAGTADSILKAEVLDNHIGGSTFRGNFLPPLSE